MADAKQTVLDFLAMLQEPEGFPKAIKQYFTASTAYENVGMSKTTGIEEAVEFAKEMDNIAPGGTILVENLAVAADGNKVLTERHDHFIDTDGNKKLTIAVMGIFEVADGKIVSWREYFDTVGFAGQMPE